LHYTNLAGKEFDKWSADVKNNPNNANSHYNLACAQALLGKKADAMASLAKAASALEPLTRITTQPAGVLRMPPLETKP